jgi:flavodoxin
MRAVVVYESLWGNTAAIARAIAEGIGPEARALSTAEASAEELSGVELLVAGAPTHMAKMPSARSRAAAAKYETATPPDLSQPLLRDWLDALPNGTAGCAAFDTRGEIPAETPLRSWFAKMGAANGILKALERKGYRPVADTEGFMVRPDSSAGPLVEGETERARAWGAQLAASVR